jgi:hypothetical protein
MLARAACRLHEAVSTTVRRSFRPCPPLSTVGSMIAGLHHTSNTTVLQVNLSGVSSAGSQPSACALMSNPSIHLQTNVTTNSSVPEGTADVEPSKAASAAAVEPVGAQAIVHGTTVSIAGVPPSHASVEEGVFSLLGH